MRDNNNEIKKAQEEIKEKEDNVAEIVQINEDKKDDVKENKN